MKINKKLIFFPIIIIIALAYFYVTFINVFNSDTLTGISITHTGAMDASFYELSETEAKLLASNLEAGRFKETPPEEASVFSISLLNKWHLSKPLIAYLSNSGEVYIEDPNKGTIKRLNRALFFHDHEGFDAHYKDLQFPELKIISNHVETKFTIQNHQWFFKRLSGVWVQNNTSQSNFTETHHIIESKEDDIFVLSSKPISQINLTILNTESNQSLFFENIKSDLPLPVPNQNGHYQYLIELEWLENESNFKGNALLSTFYTVSLPAEFSLSKQTIAQDDFLELFAYNVSDINNYHVVQPFIDDFKWFKQDGFYSAFVPINFKTPPGDHTISIIDLSTESAQNFQITVLEREYKIQNLIVDQSTVDSTRNDEAFAEYRMYFVPVRDTSHPNRFFDEIPFLLPVEGRLTTEFGEKRNVNGSLTSYRHNGIDIAAPLGTPVMSTHHGVVAFEMDMILTGKTIIIDHGQGIFSVYEHLDEIHVNTGDRVNRGDVIGTVGSTGFSTGPHLHFMISYYQYDLDPGYFIIGEPYTKEKHSQLIQNE